MGLKLKQADGSKDLVAIYELTHSNDKTTLALDLSLTVDASGAHAAITIEGPAMETPDDALDRLADWLERSALALRERKTNGSLPLF